MNEQTKETDYKSDGKDYFINHASIINLLRHKPVLYEVCRWEIDPITKKPVRKCWVTEPVNAPIGL